MAAGLGPYSAAFQRIARALIPEVTEDRAQDRVGRLGMSARQQKLNYLWSHYCCTAYDGRKTDWDGADADGEPIEKEAIGAALVPPPGTFVDSGKQTMPLKYRKPSAPYRLPRVIVNRLTGLLFSEKRHPKIRVPGHPDVEQWVTALADKARLWAKMVVVRNHGGAMGTACLGFKFLRGKPVIEVHDPRWCYPEFADEQFTLRRLRIQFWFETEEEVGPGKFVKVRYWFRREIDDQTDVRYKPVRVDEGDEPNWEVQEQVRHGFGFCPVVWIQNAEVTDSVDGESDLHGCLEAIEALDCLIAQMNRGTIYNLDPTLLLKTAIKISEIDKGSGAFVRLPNPGDDASYLEITGQGIEIGLKMREMLRSQILETAQVVVEHPDVSQKTATEIERVYSAMTAKADSLREQYGQCGVIPLLTMMSRAAMQVSRARVTEDGSLVRGALLLGPDVPVVDWNEVPEDLDIDLQWPGYFDPSLQEVGMSVDAAGKAKLNGLVDDEHAAKFVAKYFDVEDVTRMLDKAKQAQREEADILARQIGRGEGEGV